MTLQIRTTLADGISRTVTRNGAVLVGVYLLAVLLQAGFIFAATTTYLPISPTGVPVAGVGDSGPTPGTPVPTLVSLQAALIATMTGGLLTVPIHIVAIRTLVGGYATRIPDRVMFHRLGWATLNRFIGVWLTTLLLLVSSVGALIVGSFALSALVPPQTQQWLLSSLPGQLVVACFTLGCLIPAAFLGVSLIFVSHEIAIHDKHIGDALIGSWRITRRNRLRLFVLFMIPVLPLVMLSFIMSTVLSPVVAQVIALVASAVVSVLTIGILTPAYIRITDVDIDALPHLTRQTSTDP